MIIRVDKDVSLDDLNKVYPYACIYNLRGMAMRCPYCGFENADRTSFCNSCGKEIGSPIAAPRMSDPRHCVACGRSIQSDANVCPYCGHDYRAQWMRPQAVEQISSGMRILFYILSLIFPLAGFIIGIIYYAKQDPESKHVGKICIVLAIVGLFASVGLAVILYVLVLGFGTDDGMQTPAAALSRNTVTNGVKFTFVSVSISSLYWADVTIILTDGLEFVSWSPYATDLNSGFDSELLFPAESLYTINVTCAIHDLAGNGLVNGGDYFTLTTNGGPTFSSGTEYTVTIVYGPTGSSMTSSSFTG
jgi:DNA-directed RNA polymerase subunit RPC12/RpoP